MHEAGIGAQIASGAHSNDGVAAAPAGQPIEEPGSDTEHRADGAAGERVPSEALRTDPIPPAANAAADEPARRDAPASPPPARETALRTDPMPPAANAAAEEPAREAASRALLFYLGRLDARGDPQAIKNAMQGSKIDPKTAPAEMSACSARFANAAQTMQSLVKSAPPGK